MKKQDYISILLVLVSSLGCGVLAMLINPPEYMAGKTVEFIYIIDIAGIYSFISAIGLFIVLSFIINVNKEQAGVLSITAFVSGSFAGVARAIHSYLKPECIVPDFNIVPLLTAGLTSVIMIIVFGG